LSKCRLELIAMCLVSWLVTGLENAWGQDKPTEPPTPGWSNSTDLSLVLTAGNSTTRTWGFSEELRHVWTNARFQFEANVVRSDTPDDRFFLIAPGLEFPVGGAPANPATSLVVQSRRSMSPHTSSAEPTNGTSRRVSSGTRAQAGTATTMPAS
jgi:hypothetical protein